ncbi:MAG: ABC transporter ATP-binding protein [Candidatus Thermoplasmatota archaeon]|nr:ABC transporter ATP-binding protein [Candidatus Thermoplasmatota archaeon]
MESQVVVQARSLRKVYDIGKVQVHALKGIDLDITKGEMVSVMGPSGCGKTTLLNCLSGIDDPTEGHITIEGQALEGMSDDKKTEYRAKRIGFIFQAYNLLPVLTAVENVELPLLLAGVKLKEARVRALKTLDLVGLKKWESHRPSELSGGEQQRVAIARSLVNNPAIVFGDELTGNLDEETSTQVMDLICDLNEKNKQTFVIVTHDPAVGEQAHRVLRLRDGLIEKEYRPIHSG